MTRRPPILARLNRGELVIAAGTAFTLAMVVLARVYVHDDSFLTFAYLAITGVAFTLMGIPLALLERSGRWSPGGRDGS